MTNKADGTNKTDTRRKRGFRLLRKRLRVSACYGMLADVTLLARKSEGFGMINKTDGTNKTDTRRKARVSHFAEKASGIGLLWDACGCCTIGEKKRGFRLDMGDFRDADTANCH